MEDEEEGLGCAPTGVMTLAVSAMMGIVALVVGVIVVGVIASSMVG